MLQHIKPNPAVNHKTVHYAENNHSIVTVCPEIAEPQWFCLCIKCDHVVFTNSTSQWSNEMTSVTAVFCFPHCPSHMVWYNRWFKQLCAQFHQFTR